MPWVVVLDYVGYPKLSVEQFSFISSLVFREPRRGQLLGLYLCVLHYVQRSTLVVH